MKTITLKADGVIREAVHHYLKQIERESLRQQMREAKTGKTDVGRSRRRKYRWPLSEALFI